VAVEDGDDCWAPLAERFVVDHYASLRGRVRNRVLHEHLRQHLPRPPATLVDVGGGGGDQSIPLASEGYRVTIVEPSAAMLDRARRRLAGEPEAVAARVRLVQAAGEQAGEALGGERFGGVLCHGVVMYVEPLAPFVAALAALAAPGGIVSIVAKNAEALAVRPATEGDWTGALRAFDARRQVNGLGLDTRADTVDELTALLAAEGVDAVAWYGVRLFTDWMAGAGDEAGSAVDAGADAGAGAGGRGSTGSAGGLEAVLAVELEASRRDPYRRLSRLFHLIGRARPR
jgi:SAM-dependent methyltransferase